ncbi:hypothetical protein R5R35_008905 [Gryllus longicercus]|uniref:Uncharacterized protein n=1 Tax=Gryllus longicercus TaxID=2509291 RepID=A0AAN9Z937_9ORTH
MRAEADRAWPGAVHKPRPRPSARGWRWLKSAGAAALGLVAREMGRGALLLAALAALAALALPGPSPPARAARPRRQAPAWADLVAQDVARLLAAPLPLGRPGPLLLLPPPLPPPPPPPPPPSGRRLQPPAPPPRCLLDPRTWGSAPELQPLLLAPAGARFLRPLASGLALAPGQRVVLACPGDGNALEAAPAPAPAPDEDAGAAAADYYEYPEEAAEEGVAAAAAAPEGRSAAWPGAGGAREAEAVCAARDGRAPAFETPGGAPLDPRAARCRAPPAAAVRRSNASCAAPAAAAAAAPAAGRRVLVGFELAAGFLPLYSVCEGEGEGAGPLFAEAVVARAVGLRVLTRAAALEAAGAAPGGTVAAPLLEPADFVWPAQQAAARLALAVVALGRGVRDAFWAPLRQEIRLLAVARGDVRVVAGAAPAFVWAAVVDEAAGEAAAFAVARRGAGGWACPCGADACARVRWVRWGALAPAARPLCCCGAEGVARLLPPPLATRPDGRPWALLAHWTPRPAPAPAPAPASPAALGGS